jgi:Rrf2 family transcriptional regulator, iron-sulfur cluster assembly transcription factor
MISKACKYAIRAAVFVASQAGKSKKFSVKDIAREVDAPEAFTAKILQVLNKHRILTSLKGPYGGFYIEDYQLEQPIINIVHAIDGTSVFWECGLGLKKCSGLHPCPMHDKFEAAREMLRQVFAQTTIGQLAIQIQQGTSFVNNLPEGMLASGL